MRGESDVVVVGGGVMGAAALYYLTALGCPDPVLIERETLGAGSTGRCAGGVRTLFSDELNVRVCLESIRRLERFEEEVGAPLDLRLWGYLFLLDDAHDVDQFAHAVSVNHRHGIPSRMTTPEEAREIVPQLALDGLRAGAFNPLAGYVTPESVVQGYAQAAAARGAEIVQSCAAAQVLVEDGRVVGIETDRGAIATDTVVCTAGIWSRELAATAGVDLPMDPQPRWMFFTEDAPDFPAELPLTVDVSTGFYFHREGSALALGSRQQSAEELAPVAVRRVPALEELGIRSSWWGWYEMSPDHNALVGASADPAGFVYATGFSGHGFQQAPVIGEHLAELALGLDPTFDLSVFSAERFAVGATRVERNVI